MNLSGKFLPTAATVGAVGAAGGMAARLLRHIIDSGSGAAARPRRGGMKAPISPIAEVPVDVTPEEAEELMSRGVNVKFAGFFDSLGDRVASGIGDVAVRLAKPVGVGFAGAGMAYGGYKLIDKLIRAMREKSIKSDIASVRRRIKSLADESPEVTDEAFFDMMKTAETVYFNDHKDADDADRAYNLAKTAAAFDIGLALLGAGAFAQAAGAFGKVRRENLNRQKIDALRKMLNRDVQAPVVTSVPVLRLSKVLEERRKKQPPVKQPPVLPPKAEPKIEQRLTEAPAKETSEDEPKQQRRPEPVASSFLY